MEAKQKKKKNQKINLTFPICVALAVFLWLYVMTEKNPEITHSYYEVPVKVLNKNTLSQKGLYAMNLADFTATVSLKGLKSDVLAFNRERIDLSIDLSGYGEGEMKIPIKASLKEPKYDLKIDRIDPTEFIIHFDKMITSAKPVRIIRTGEVAVGTLRASVESDLKTVSVKGPRSIVEKVSYAEATVNLEGKDDNSSFLVPIKLKDEDGDLVEGVYSIPSEVSGKILIKTVAEIPVAIKLTGELPKGSVITAMEYSPKTVKVIGSKEAVRVKEIPTVPINLSELSEDGKTETTLSLPKGLKILSGDDKVSVSVSYTRETKTTIAVPKNEITIDNVPEGLDATITEDYISVILMGAYEKLAKAIPELSLVLTDNEQKAGTYSVSPTISGLPEGVRAELSPPKATVNVFAPKKNESQEP